MNNDIKSLEELRNLISGVETETVQLEELVRRIEENRRRLDYYQGILNDYQSVITTEIFT